MYIFKVNLTVKEVAEALDIYDVSAKEMIEGVIPWELGELAELAQYKGITINELLLHSI